jgi:hypothetical protein
VTVTVIGGSSSLTDLNAALDVHVYAATYHGTTGGITVCNMVEAIIVDQPLAAIVDGKRMVIDTVAGSMFHEVPWDDDTVRHFMTTVQVSARRV